MEPKYFAEVIGCLGYKHVVHGCYFSLSPFVPERHRKCDERRWILSTLAMSGVYFNIPGSSRYVKFLPFGRFFRVKRHKFYTLGRSRYTWNLFCLLLSLGPSKTRGPHLGSRCIMMYKGQVNIVNTTHINTHMNHIWTWSICHFFSPGGSTCKTTRLCFSIKKQESRYLNFIKPHESSPYLVYLPCDFEDELGFQIAPHVSRKIRLMPGDTNRSPNMPISQGRFSKTSHKYI